MGHLLSALQIHQSSIPGVQSWLRLSGTINRIKIAHPFSGTKDRLSFLFCHSSLFFFSWTAWRPLRNAAVSVAILDEMGETLKTRPVCINSLHFQLATFQSLQGIIFRFSLQHWAGIFGFLSLTALKPQRSTRQHYFYMQRSHTHNTWISLFVWVTAGLGNPWCTVQSAIESAPQLRRRPRFYAFQFNFTIVASLFQAFR